MAARDDIQSFYDGLQTLPKLIGDLALSVAEAQRRLDQDYLDSLAAFSKIVIQTLKDSTITAEQYTSLFKSIAPSRYQFTETTVEVRADLQMTSSTELGIGGTIGIKTAVFAATINASYTKRSAYDYQAASVIRTVLNAVPADPGLLDKLLNRAGTPPTATLPSEARYKVLAEIFKDLPKLTGGAAPPTT